MKAHKNYKNATSKIISTHCVVVWRDRLYTRALAQVGPGRNDLVCFAELVQTGLWTVWASYPRNELYHELVGPHRPDPCQLFRHPKPSFA